MKNAYVLQGIKDEMINVQASIKAKEKIKHFEGLKLSAYRDSGGVWTVGYGETGDHVGPGKELTPHQAEVALQIRLNRLSDQVTELLQVEVEQHQFDALVSLAYNIGIGAFKRSTLLKKLNSGDFEGAAKQFTRWVYDNGHYLPGLKKRRLAERALFLGENSETI